MRQILPWFAVVFCLSTGILQAQVLDSLFGVPYSFTLVHFTPGATSSDFINRDDRCYAALHLPGGKIILAGHTSSADGTDMALLHLLSDGTYDEGVGPGGRIRTNFGHYADSCVAAVLDAEGRILTAGATHEQGQIMFNILVARTDTLGRPDSLFGNNGSVVIDLPPTREIITKIIPLPDGRILIAGDAYYGDDYYFPDSTRILVGRLWPDGSVDTSFGNNGFFYLQFDSGCNSSMLGDIAVDSEGRVLVSGASYFIYPLYFFPTTTCWHVVDLFRYTSGGLPDNSFGTGGKLTLPHTQGHASVLHIGNNDEIVPAGSVTNFEDLHTPVHIYLGRVLAGGTMDSTFAYYGRFIRHINGGVGPAAPSDLLELADHYYMGFEDDAQGTGLYFGLLRFSKTGAWDMSFGNNGVFNTEGLLPYIGGEVTQISTVDSNYIFISGYHQTTALQKNNMFIAKVKLNNVVSAAEAVKEESKLRIFPNPVSGGVLNVDYSGFADEGLVQLRLSDMQGRLLWQRQVPAPGGIGQADVSQLPPGMYVLEVSNGVQRAVRRVVVAR